MKAHVKRSEKAKQRKLDFAREQREKKRRYRERRAIISSTVKALSAKPNSDRSAAKAVNFGFAEKMASFGARYGMQTPLPGISRADREKLKKVWDRLVYGADQTPEMMRQYAQQDMLVSTDYAGLELRVMAAGILDHKTARR